MGLTPEASQDEIKRAYRKLARKYHPDVSKEPDAEAKFKELGEAYEALKDPEKRTQYDTLRKQGWHGGEEFNVPPNWQQGFRYEHAGPEDGGDFSDFFEFIFGQQPGQHRREHGFRHQTRKGEDVHYILEVDPLDSYEGATKKIEIPIMERTEEGRLVRKTRTVNVKIPKGVVNGQQIRLKGQGGEGLGAGSHRGDLYLEIRLKPKEPYSIEGKDVTVYLPITPWEAALGDKVRVPTLGGFIDVKIPPNSQTGNKLRLKSRGLPGNPPGDQYVVLQIVTPPATSEIAKELYQQMAEKIAFNPREKLGA